MAPGGGLTDFVYSTISLMRVNLKGAASIPIGQPLAAASHPFTLST
jgi:hypothetical protein